MRLIDADVAIEELTDRSHQAAKRVGTDSPFWEGLVIARRIANNLPTIQPEPTDEQKSCEYCHEDSDGYTRPIEKNCHAYIRFGMNGWELDLKAKGWHGEAQIKFCPMCGRKLQGGQ